MHGKRIGLALLATALLVGACGRLGDDGGTTGSSGGDGGIEHPTGSDQLVLRVEYQGGFVPYEYMLKRVPSWSLYGDGTVIVEGPVIEIYPGPALPNLLAFTLTEEAVQAILEAAQDAGLMDGDATYGYPCIADAADTVFTVNADGTTSVVSAYALELSDLGDGSRQLRGRGHRGAREARRVQPHARRPAELGAGGFDRPGGTVRADRDARVRPPLPG